MCIPMCVALHSAPCVTGAPRAQVPMHTITILLGLVFC